MHLHRPLSLLLVATAALTGCDYEHLSACETAALEPAILEIGTGEQEYEALEDGDWVEPIWGPQGGQHIWMGLRATGIDPGTGLDAQNTSPAVTWQAWYGDTELGWGESHTRLLESDGAYQTQGETLFLSSGAIYDLMDEMEMEMEMEAELEIEVVATLEDNCGTVLTTSRQLILAL